MKKKLLTGLSFIGILILFILIKTIVTPTVPEAQPTQIQVPTTFTSAEQDYATTTGKQAITLNNALTELGELFQNPHYGNEDWTLKTATQLTIIQTVYNKAIELEPPDSMTHIHYKYVQALKHYNTGAEIP